jgi:flagellar assembly protein FliH
MRTCRIISQPDPATVRKVVLRSLSPVATPSALAAAPSLEIQPAAPVAPLPDAAELAALREAARQEGLQAGLTEGRAQGLEDGHRQGFEQGYADGQAAAREAALPELERLKALLPSTAAELSAVELSLTAYLTALQATILAALEGPDTATLPARVERAISTLASTENLVICLNPTDVALLQSALPEMISDLGARLVEDPGLAAGGFRLKSATGEIDATLKNRIAEVKRILNELA